MTEAEHRRTARMSRFEYRYTHEPETMSDDERFLYEEYRDATREIVKFALMATEATLESNQSERELQTHREIVDVMLERDLGLKRDGGTPRDESSPDAPAD